MTLLNDSLSAYLTPLLQKHTAGKAIIYDDLIQSWKAAEQVMKADFDPAVSKQLRELHESQLAAYEEAARAALQQQAQSVALPEAQDNNMEEDEYVAKILQEIQKPDWKVNETVWEEAWEAPLRERASAALSGQEEDDDNEEMEEGEEEDNGKQEEAEEGKPKPATKNVFTKKRTIATKAGKGLLKKKSLSGGATKPTGAAGTPGQRAIRGRRPRRGGRGGGAAGAAK